MCACVCYSDRDSKCVLEIPNTHRSSSHLHPLLIFLAERLHTPVCDLSACKDKEVYVRKLLHNQISASTISDRPIIIIHCHIKLFSTNIWLSIF